MWCSTSYSAPRFRGRGKRLVSTLHDLSFLTHPECHTSENIAHSLKGTQDAIAWADILIAVSQHTRDELIERMAVAPDRVVVIHEAPNPACVQVYDPAVLARVRVAYQLPPVFVLFLGSLEPRKNVLRLLRAYASLSPGLRSDVHLVIAGGVGWKNSEVRPTVQELGLSDQVHFIGYIPEHDLPAVYSLASVFAYPSLSEGFGLPVLEAMQCGVPVLTSNVSSLPEVAGEAAVLVSPTDSEAIAHGLTCLLEQTSLQTELRERGYEQVKQFSWDRCARETLEVYRQVYEAR